MWCERHENSAIFSYPNDSFPLTPVIINIYEFFFNMPFSQIATFFCVFHISYFYSQSLKRCLSKCYCEIKPTLRKPNGLYLPLYLRKWAVYKVKNHLTSKMLTGCLTLHLFFKTIIYVYCLFQFCKKQQQADFAWSDPTLKMWCNQMQSGWSSHITIYNADWQ